MRLSTTRAAHCRELADRFVRETRQDTFEVGEAVRWAMERGELEISPDDEFDFLRKMMAEALRSDVTEDQDGNKVRLRYCRTVSVEDEDGEVRQQVLWAHLHEASDEHLILSFREMTAKHRELGRRISTNLRYVNQYLTEHGRRPIQLSLPWDVPGEDAAAS